MWTLSASPFEICCQIHGFSSLSMDNKAGTHWCSFLLMPGCAFNMGLLNTSFFNLKLYTLDGFLIQQSYITLFQWDLPMGVLSTYYLFYSWKFFPNSAHAFIGYFKATWHLTMKLFPAKIYEQATLQNLWCQRVTVQCYPRKLTDNLPLQQGLMKSQL